MLDPNQPRAVELVIEALRTKAQKGSSKLSHAIALLVISLLLFVGEQHTTAGETASWVGALVVVLAVHEAGHFLTMRAFGYADLRVFFIPFLGAAVSGRKLGATGSQRAIVSLMGPLPSLALTFVAVWFAPYESMFVTDLVYLSLGLNLFNLLPFVPLDGGRFLEATVFCRWPGLRAAANLVSGLALVGIGWYLDAWILCVFGAFICLVANAAGCIAKGAADLRAELPEGFELTETIPDDLVPTGMRITNARFFDRAPKSAQPKGYANMMTAMWDQVGYLPSSVAAAIGLILLYLWTIFVGIAGFAVLAVMIGE